MEKKIAFLFVVTNRGEIVDSAITRGLASSEEINDMKRGIAENETDSEVLVHEVEDCELFDGTMLSAMIESMNTLDTVSNRYVFGDMLRKILEKGFEFGIEYSKPRP